jgi:hypothetical protein
MFLSAADIFIRGNVRQLQNCNEVYRTELLCTAHRCQDDQRDTPVTRAFGRGVAALRQRAVLP